jgi:hypothetical protein
MLSKGNHPVGCKIIILKLNCLRNFWLVILGISQDRDYDVNVKTKVSSKLQHHKYNTEKKYKERTLKSYKLIRVLTYLFMRQ